MQNPIFFESKSIFRIRGRTKVFSNTTRIRQLEAGPFIAVIYVRLRSFPAAPSVAGHNQLGDNQCRLHSWTFSSASARRDAKS